MFKKNFIKVELMYKDQSQGSYIEPAEKPFPIELDSAHEYYQISLVKMTQKEYEKLPEFNGF